MTKGTIYPPESTYHTDARTGARIRQITNHPSIHHQPFFLIPAYDDAMRWTVFTSARAGQPQIFVEERATGNLIQLTDRDDLSDFSIYPSHDGQYVYFTAGSGGWRVHTETYAEELLIDLGQARLREQGMIGAAMGTTALSACDRWWAIRFRNGADACIAVVDTVSGQWEVILQRDNVDHMQFCPDDANLLYYAGPLTDRVWVINRDGSNNRRLYQRTPGQWITHEAWIPGTRELGLVDWPNGMIAVHVDTGARRRVTSFNAWHAIASQDGTRMVADTNFPDIGIQVFDPLDGVGAPSTLCYPEASSLGEHWNGPFPYDNGPINVYAPQYTHPHPSFSPDKQFVIYTSDRTGFAQVYEVEI
ncbi:MAG: oligogalacturonate lyase family protein [Caldilineaceae bacterium]